jgi:hypothetical protein
MSLDEMAEQHAFILEGLGRDGGGRPLIRLQTMMAHYRAGEARTRLEPWMFATGTIRVGLADWLCWRFDCRVAFWGDRFAMFALAPDGDRARAPWGATARSLGPFRPTAIAHAIRESAPMAATFLGFDPPAPSFCEALIRATFGR